MQVPDLSFVSQSGGMQCQREREVAVLEPDQKSPHLPMNCYLLQERLCNLHVTF